MTTIPSIFNTGTGLSIVSASSSLPSQVNDLVVLNTLTVNGETNLKGDVLMEQDVTVLQQTNLNSLNVNNNAVLNSVGSSGNTQFSLPSSTGTNNQVLSILDDQASPQTTEWRDDNVINDYVSYDTTSNKLQNNLNQNPPSDIDILIAENIEALDTLTADNVVIGDSNSDDSKLTLVNFDSQLQTTSFLNVEDKTFDFSVDYPGIISTVPKLIMRGNAQAGQTNITLSIESSQFEQSIEMTPDGININNSNNPIRIQQPNGVFWTYPNNFPQVGDQMTISGGSGSQFDPYTTEWS